MKINSTKKQYMSDAVASNLIKFLENNEDSLGLTEAELYYDFPLYKDFDGEVVISDLLLVSPNHGVITIGTSSITSTSDNMLAHLHKSDSNTEQVFTFLYSRLIINKELRKTKTQLKFPADAVLFSPFIDANLKEIDTEINLLRSYKGLEDYLNRNRRLMLVNR